MCLSVGCHTVKHVKYRCFNHIYEFIVYARSGTANAVQNQILRGRPYGGVAVFVRKALSSYVTCTYGDNVIAICVR